MSASLTISPGARLAMEPGDATRSFPFVARQPRLSQRRPLATQYAILYSRATLPADNAEEWDPISVRPAPYVALVPAEPKSSIRQTHRGLRRDNGFTGCLSFILRPVSCLAPFSPAGAGIPFCSCPGNAPESSCMHPA
jgi:hypothetical protein